MAKCTVIKGPKPIEGALVCCCSKEYRHAIDRGQRCYTEIEKNEFVAGAPDKVRVVACDTCKGAILWNGCLQVIQ